MFPEQQIEELLSLAHVQAIASRAGVSIAYFNRDFGIDGTFRPITVFGSRRCFSGVALDFQLKASTQFQIEPEHIVYDLEVKTYNDLIRRRIEGSSISCILILKILPSNSGQWLETSENGLFLRGGCYWEYLEGTLSSNRQTVRIRLPREQQLTPESLLWLLNNLA